MPSGKYRDFWLKYDSGAFTVGRGTDVGHNTILSWTDPSPMTFNSIGFGTESAAGEWRACLSK